MPVPDLHPLVRLSLVCVAAVGLAWFVVGWWDGDGDPPAVLDAETTTTTPPLFPSPPAGGSGVVRVDDLVLPVIGGEEGAWVVLTPCANQMVVDGERLTGAHVVIDPGHGGEETGAIGPTGVVEAELNLDVARMAAERLEAEGATVVLTRDTDTRVTIRTRVEIVRALGPELFVSIHHNGGPTTDAERPGVQVYHQHETPASARFAGLLFEELQASLAPFSEEWSGGNATGVRARLSTDGSDYYGVLRETHGVPAVLAEALYLSSEPEASLLADPAVRAAEADAIAAAVATWLETGRAGSGYLPPLHAAESAGGGGGTAGCDDPDELAAG